MEAAVGGLERFFARDFLPWHNALYRGRPVFWGFGGNGRIVAVSRLNLDLKVMRSAFARIGQTLPDGWRHWPDDGVQINLSPLAPMDRRSQAAASPHRSPDRSAARAIHILRNVQMDAGKAQSRIERRMRSRLSADSQPDSAGVA